MESHPLVVAWGWLVGLSVATTALTLVDTGGARGVAVTAGVLALAGLKSRLILARYLGLSNSRFWMRAFTGAIGAFLVIAFVTYLIGEGS